LAKEMFMQSSKSQQTIPAHEESHPHAEHNHDDHKHDDHQHHDHDNHEHGTGPWGWLTAIFHSHDHAHDHSALATEQSFLDNQEGIRTVWLALGLLLLTTVLQTVIFWLSGSVALLADTAHNLVDALNSLPLLIAFYLARRPPTRRYNYGFGKAEDVAGIFIVLSIAVSAGFILWESFLKLLHPQPLTNVFWVAAAAIIGALGNEAVAFIQIRTGRKIGSAAMEADGLHARTDGLTSLAVLVAAIGSWLGFSIVDPMIGLLIGVAILFITRQAAWTMWQRLMDAVEPKLLDKAEQAVTKVQGVHELGRVRMRWMGNRLHAEVHIAVDPQLTTAESHAIAEEVRHTLFHNVARLAEVVVHVEPWSIDGDSYHQETTHHEGAPQRLASEK
jgi:cation diffusion facilitator family transporter